MADDYRTLLADSIGSVTTVTDVYLSGTVTKVPHHMSGNEAAVTADLVIGLRVPWLCPDCKGSNDGMAETVSPTGYTQLYGCTHSHAPTIGDLLRWGEAADMYNDQNSHTRLRR